MKFLFLCSLILTVNAQNVKDPKIIGGVDADIHEFPSMVALVYGGVQQCGGSLVSELWVLTAAHCKYPIDSNFKIEYGSADLGKGQFSYPEFYVVHEDFSPSRLSNDIALIKLKTPAITGYQNPFTKLAFPGFRYTTGTPAVVAGWGVWSHVNSTMPPLQKLEVQIWHYRDCQVVFKDIANDGDSLVYSTNICAGLPDFSKAHCTGDSGGALLVDGIQVGIVSWSRKPCAVAKYPGVYTAVASYIDWISENTGIDFTMKMFLSNSPQKFS